MILSTMDLVAGRLYVVIKGSRARVCRAKKCNGVVYLYSSFNNLPLDLSTMWAHGDFDRIMLYGEYLAEQGAARRDYESQAIVDEGRSYSELVDEKIHDFLEAENVLAETETLALASYVIRDRTMTIARFREEIARLRAS